MQKPWAGIKLLIVAVACLALGLPIAGTLAGIAVYFKPDGMDSVGIGWGTTYISLIATTLLGLVLLVLSFIKGGTFTRLVSLAFTVLGIFVISMFHAIS